VAAYLETLLRDENPGSGQIDILNVIRTQVPLNTKQKRQHKVEWAVTLLGQKNLNVVCGCSRRTSLENI